MAFAARFTQQKPGSRQTSTKSNIFSYNELSNNEKKKYTWNGVSNRPSTIYNLNCSNRNLEKLPIDLPDSIEEIDCSFNKIKELPEKLPSKLELLNCSFNELNKLPINLPDSIQIIAIQFNKNLEDIPLDSLPNLRHLYLDERQFLKFFEKIKNDYKKKNYLLQLYIYSLQTNKKINEDSIQRKLKNNVFIVKKPIQFAQYMEKLPSHIQIRLKKNYNIPNVIRINEGGSKTVKNSKNLKKINMKKSELQKIALKNKVSLKKRDGTMKKKDELFKSLKLKKLL